MMMALDGSLWLFMKIQAIAEAVQSCSNWCSGGEDTSQPSSLTTDCNGYAAVLVVYDPF